MYVCMYVRACVRTCVRTNVRTYVRKQFAFRRRFHPRMYVRTYVYFLKPQAVPNGTYVHTCVRINYRTRAAKHYGTYVLTVSLTYVLAYVPGRTVRTCVPTYPRNVPFEIPRYLTVSLTYVRTYLHVRTYRHTHLRTVRTVSPSHCTGGVSLLSCIPSAARTGQRRS